MTAVEVLGGIIAAQTVGMALVVRAVLHMGNDVSRHQTCIELLRAQALEHKHPTAIGPTGVPL